MNKQEGIIRLSGIIYESLVNGPGMRRVFFSQGCTHDCEGCFNKHTHSFTEGELFDIIDLVKDVEENPIITGITFSGGDPFEQSENFAEFALELKNLNLNIWCYTGYTFEYIQEHLTENPYWEKLLYNIDVLVDGPFIKELKDRSLKFRGSSNQRIIDVKESLKLNNIVKIDY